MDGKHDIDRVWRLSIYRSAAIQ